MTFSCPVLETPIVFQENRVEVLVVENNSMYRNIIMEIMNQVQGWDGEFAVSEDGVNLNFSKAVCLIPSVFSLSFDDKKITSKLQKDANVIAEGHLSEVMEIAAKLNKLAFDISTDFTFPVKFNPIDGPSQLIKLFDYGIDYEDAELLDNIIEYMKIHREIFGRNLFIFVALRTFFTKEELELFYKMVSYEKLNILLLENNIDSEVSEYERVVIIDKDFCII